MLCNRIFDVVPLPVKPMLLYVANPMLMYLVVDVKSHHINEEMASMMIQRFCLIVNFDAFAIVVQDDFAVKDVTKSQQWSVDVTDVDSEPNWEADVVAHEQDVFVAIDVDRLIGRCRKSKLCVVWLKRYMICEVSRCNRSNSAGVTKYSPATKKSSR